MTDFPQPTFIDVNGITLEVFTAGTPGRPIVLCHGFPNSPIRGATRSIRWWQPVTT
jgi:hypothetical protein